MTTMNTLFRLAFLATGGKVDDARSFVDRTLAAGDDSPTELIARLFRLMAGELHRSAQVSFLGLDNILRSDLTTTDGVEHQEARDELLWDLKRTCLARTLACISPPSRLAYILHDIHGLSQLDAAAVLECNPKALGVRLTRARHRLSGYLDARCSHIVEDNVCTCKGRLGIALRKQFISPSPVLPAPDGAVFRQRVRDVTDLYRRLPVIQPAACP